MEIIVYLLNLSQILILHASACSTLGAVLTGIGEEDLVYHNVVDVDFLLGKLNSQSLSLIHGQEFWNAHSDESSLLRVFELLVDLLNLGLHAVDAIKKFLLQIFTTFSILVHHGLHLVKHASKLVL